MNNLPTIKQVNGRHVFIVDNKPFIMLGAEAHNSAATSFSYMENVWQRAEEVNCNTLMAPVYWECMEPTEGEFDFSLVKSLIDGAREHGLRLVLTWFGSWKNGCSTYIPGWMKKDTARFPRALDEAGSRLNILTMFEGELLSVEKRSFSVLMDFLKAYDGDNQTVLAIQIENEVGILGAKRDYSVGASRTFELWEKGISLALEGHSEQTISIVENAFEAYPNEAFMGWYYGCHINELARAGKEIYGLPMCTNVWLKESDDEVPGTFPCGGPQPGILDLWKCAAPALDIISPDLYSFSFDRFAALYTRADNPLFILETRRDKWAVANLYLAIGRYNALCFAPFGAESIGLDRSFITGRVHTNPNDKNVSSPMMKDYLAKSYEVFANMMPIITANYGSGKIIGFSQDLSGKTSERLSLGNYHIDIEYYHKIDDDNEFIPGAGIAILEAENKFTFVGYGYEARVVAKASDIKIDYLTMEKGYYKKDSSWHPTMLLNGDEQRLQMEETPICIRTELYNY